MLVEVKNTTSGSGDRVAATVSGWYCYTFAILLSRHLPLAITSGLLPMIDQPWSRCSYKLLCEMGMSAFLWTCLAFSSAISPPLDVTYLDIKFICMGLYQSFPVSVFLSSFIWPFLTDAIALPFSLGSDSQTCLLKKEGKYLGAFQPGFVPVCAFLQSGRGHFPPSPLLPHVFTQFFSHFVSFSSNQSPPSSKQNWKKKDWIYGKSTAVEGRPTAITYSFLNCQPCNILSSLCGFIATFPLSAKQGSNIF